MLVGPFDRRKKRSRCQACSTSHLKCSGQAPCSNCERRRVTCSFPGKDAAPQPFILVERGSQQTTATWSQRRKQQYRAKAEHKPSQAVVHASLQLSSAVNATCLASTCRLTDDKWRYLHFFDIFITQNSFDGKPHNYLSDIRRLPGLHASPAVHLTDAMLSIGALQAVKMGHPTATERKMMISSALEFYSKSLAGLRDALSKNHGRASGEVRDAVLWSTLFLGLFELTNDVTGLGWRQHLIYGTAKALEATGPIACSTSHSLRFFMQARVVEICRMISFNEDSFLAQPEWLQLTRQLATSEAAEDWRPLDALLDTMVLCANLRVRTAKFIRTQQESPDAEPTPEARSISLDGFSLRGALNSWNNYYSEPVDYRIPTTITPKPEGPPNDRATSSGCSGDGSSNDKDDCMLLARVFFAATSIYLSGVFDYETVYWRRLGLLTSCLDEATIQRHLRTILDLASVALETTTLSPLLFLFPMRIAGARAREQWQRDRILTLVGKIRSKFAVAAAITRDLGQVWKAMPSDGETHTPQPSEWDGDVESIPTLITYHSKPPRAQAYEFWET